MHPTDDELAQRERVADHRELATQQIDRRRAGLGCGVSRCTFFCTEIAVELAQESIAILISPISQMRDEGLDLLASGFPKSFDPAEVGGVRLDQGGV